MQVSDSIFKGTYEGLAFPSRKAVRERRACKVSARTFTPRAELRHGGTGFLICADAIEFKPRARADAKGGSQRCEDASTERTSKNDNHHLL